jgi:hypothetical protein
VADAIEATVAGVVAGSTGEEAVTAAGAGLNGGAAEAAGTIADTTAGTHHSGDHS